MATRVLWAIAACASLIASVGCGEVDNCREGEDGCIKGRPLASGACRYDLVVDPLTDVCVASSGDGDDGDDDDDDDDDIVVDPNPCGCQPNQVCQSDGVTCVGICEIPGGAVAPKDSLPVCRTPRMTFAEAAVAWCKQSCTRRAAICGEACDPAQACDMAAAIVQIAQVDKTCTPVAGAECAMALCETARDRRCEDQPCPFNNARPNCTGIVCSDSCTDGTDTLNKDGVCDDGDLSNAVSAICPWGSDCGDCGPRRGTAPPAVRKLGEQCIDPFQCGASYTDFSRVPGWCVPLNNASQIEHCVPDCTNSFTCADGYTCRELRSQDVTGKESRIEDETGRTAHACFPTQCGV